MVFVSLQLLQTLQSTSDAAKSLPNISTTSALTSPTTAAGGGQCQILRRGMPNRDDPSAGGEQPLSLILHPHSLQQLTQQQQFQRQHRQLSDPHLGIDPNFSHQNRRRPVYQRGGTAVKTETEPPRRTPVYLRPEQNIPAQFLASAAFNFKPIVEDERGVGGGGGREAGCEIGREGEQPASANGQAGPSANQPEGLSRDDIVVTMRSVNV